MTGSLIVEYDVEYTNRADLLRDMRTWLTELADPDMETDDNTAVSRSGRSEKERPMGLLNGYVLNGLALTTFMTYALIRRWVFRSPLSQSPLSLTGLVATAGALPLLWRTVQDLRQNKRMGLFPFLATACMMAVLAGEALAAIEILWVLSVGMLLEEYAAERARKGIRELLEVTPDKAIIRRHGTETEIAAADIKRHDTVILHTGMKVPVDGMVLEGEALVDTAPITGRSQPQLCRAKDEVFAGTCIYQGTLLVCANRLGEETFLARVRQLVEAALSQPTRMEQRADLLAARLTRLGLLTTFLTFAFSRSLSRSFAVMLVMACPCATVLAASTAIAAAIANAARRQILIKGGVYLEQIPSTDIVCFDKTGTLTKETPHVADIIPRVPGQHVDRILLKAAGAECQATHPMARALIQEARRRNLTLRRPDQTEVFLGRGVRAVWKTDTVLVGNQEFLESNGTGVGYFKSKAAAFRAAGKTVLYVAKNGRLQGMIAVDNTPRPGLTSVLRQLREQGVSSLYLISGDAERIVGIMAEAYGFDHHQGDLLPEQKATLVEKLTTDHKVMMVGDGINDALVLSKANVGVAMGAGGSDVAVEAADIALLKSDLKDLVFLYGLGKQTLRVVEQNFWIATLTNLLGIVLAVPGWMSPVFTGALHVGHSLTILLNSGRMLSYEPRPAKRVTFRPAVKRPIPEETDHA